MAFGIGDVLQSLQQGVQAINNLNANALTAEAVINSTTSGNHTIISAVAGKIISVYSLFLSAGSSVDITFFDNTTSLTGPMPFVASQYIFLDDRQPAWFTLAVNSPFIINTSGAAQISGRCYYTQDQVT